MTEEELQKALEGQIWLVWTPTSELVRVGAIFAGARVTIVDSTSWSLNSVHMAELRIATPQDLLLDTP